MVDRPYLSRPTASAGLALYHLLDLKRESTLLNSVLLHKPEETLMNLGIRLSAEEIQALHDLTSRTSTRDAQLPEKSRHIAAEATKQAKDPFAFSSVDLICLDGIWKVLEVNDRPQGLVDTDILLNDVPETPESSIALQLAKELTAQSENGLVALILPDYFRLNVNKGAAHVSRLSPIDSYGWKTIDEFNRLACMIELAGGTPAIVDQTTLTIKNGFIHFNDQVVSSVYNRSTSFPMNFVDCHIIGDLRARYVCIDKFMSNEILTSQLGASNTVPLAVLHSDAMPAILSDLAEGDYVCLKPRFGSGGSGVRRIDKSALSSIAQSKDSPQVVSPWCTASTVGINGFQYRYSLTVYVLRTSVIGAVIRCAPAPFDGIAAANALSWVTNIGPSYALSSITIQNAQPALDLAVKSAAAIRQVVSETPIEKYAAVSSEVLSDIAGLRSRLGYSMVHPASS